MRALRGLLTPAVILANAFLEHLCLHALDLCDDFGAAQHVVDDRLANELVLFKRHLASVAITPPSPVKEKRKRVSSSEQSVEGCVRTRLTLLTLCSSPIIRPPPPKRLVLTKPAPASAAASTPERLALSALLEEIQRARDLLDDASA